MSFSEPPAAADPMLPADMFAGQVALITGGGSGTGLAMAEAFARCGATVALVGRDIERLTPVSERLGRQGLSAVPIALDVREPETVCDGFERVEQTVGPITLPALYPGSTSRLLSPRNSTNSFIPSTRHPLP